jgi:CRISPR-associated protein Csm3
MTDITLHGRIIIEASIELVTGLHIGGSSVGLEIGGVDNPIIRNPVTSRPYIPGSSLRGKMRSQTEKVLGLPQNNRIGQNVAIHACKSTTDYAANGGCPVCHVFGVSGEVEATGPTRLLVRDVQLDDESAKALSAARPDLPYAELKTEVAIDRVTSAATPRNIERVPAGSVFAPCELVFNIFQAADFDRLKLVMDAMQLVEDDYLGGSGSRGSGKVTFKDIAITARAGKDYGERKSFASAFQSVQDLTEAFAAIKSWAQVSIPTG